MDAAYPGLPLVISFGFVSWDAPPRFDFFGRLRKLESTTGKSFNRIFVRDPASLWYQHGVPGLGHDILETVTSLRKLIHQLEPSSITTIGQSMGGYGAILFGALLGAGRVLAFGPLSYLRSDWARRDGDLRWLAVMEKLERFPPAPRFDDLCSLLEEVAEAPDVCVVHGSRTLPGEALNLDGLHAARLAACPQVQIVEMADAPHAVVQWLVEHSLIDDLLRRWVCVDEYAANRRKTNFPRPCPTSNPEQRFLPVDDGWRVWIAENVIRECSADALLTVLVSHGISAGDAQREIHAAQMSPYVVAARQLLQPDRLQA